MFDASRVPQLLEQPVAKAKRQQILYGFLAEIVVYSERPLLGERAEHGVIDVVERREILTKRSQARCAPYPRSVQPIEARQWPVGTMTARSKARSQASAFCRCGECPDRRQSLG